MMFLSLVKNNKHKAIRWIKIIKRLKIIRVLNRVLSNNLPLKSAIMTFIYSIRNFLFNSSD